VLQAIGDVQQFRKETDAALTSYAQALALFKAVGDRLGEANVLASQGWLELGQDNGEAGLKLISQAMELYEQIGDRVGQTNINWRLGNMLASAGAYTEAIQLLEQTVNFVEEIKHPVAEAWRAQLTEVQRQSTENPPARPAQTDQS